MSSSKLGLILSQGLPQGLHKVKNIGHIVQYLLDTGHDFYPQLRSSWLFIKNLCLSSTIRYRLSKGLNSEYIQWRTYCARSWDTDPASSAAPTSCRSGGCAARTAGTCPRGCWTSAPPRWRIRCWGTSCLWSPLLEQSLKTYIFTL